MHSILRSIGRLSLVLLLAAVSLQKANAQTTSVCLSQPGTPWKTYFDYIAPAQPITNALTISIMRYNVRNLNLTVNELAGNMPNMTGFGKISYRNTDVSGLSCLNQLDIYIRNPQTGDASSLPFAAQFSVTSTSSTSGFIQFDGLGWRYGGTKSADTFLFKKEGGGEWLVVHFKKEVLF